MEGTTRHKKEGPGAEEFLQPLLSIKGLANNPEFAHLGELKTVEQKVSLFYEAIRDVASLVSTWSIFDSDIKTTLKYATLKNAMILAQGSYQALLNGETDLAIERLSNSRKRLNRYMKNSPLQGEHGNGDVFYACKLKIFAAGGFDGFFGLREGYNLENISGGDFESARELSEIILN